MGYAHFPGDAGVYLKGQIFYRGNLLHDLWAMDLRLGNQRIRAKKWA
jgi:hypothetical protein